MAQRLSPDRRQGDFPGRNRGPKETPAEPTGSDRGPPVPPLGEAGVVGGRGRRERGAFGSSMGTMGPVSEEPGLSLWDAMSVRGEARGAPGPHSPFARKSASICGERRQGHTVKNAVPTEDFFFFFLGGGRGGALDFSPLASFSFF